jgi:hypothetical protein
MVNIQFYSEENFHYFKRSKLKLFPFLFTSKAFIQEHRKEV